MNTKNETDDYSRTYCLNGSISEDEAVGRLMGLDIDGSPAVISVDVLLEHEVDIATNDLEEARIERKMKGKVISKKKEVPLLVAVEAAKSKRMLAGYYTRRVQHEVIRAKNGDASLLVIDSEQSEKRGMPCLTSISLYEWAQKDLKIPIMSLAPPASNHSEGNELSPTRERGLLITIGWLIEALGYSKPDLIDGGEPNVSGMAREIADLKGYSGLSDEFLRKVFKKAIDAKMEHSPSKILPR